MSLAYHDRTRTPKTPDDPTRDLVRHKIALAHEPPEPDLLVLLQAAGWRGPIYSQLHALEAVGYLLGGGAA